MGKVVLSHSVTVGLKNTRLELKQGEQEVSAEVEKALIDAGIIEAPKKQQTSKKESSE